MTDRIFVLLPARAGSLLRWLHVDAAGKASANGELGDAEMLDTGDAEVVAVAPGSSVALHWMDIAAATDRQAAAAARLIVADRVAAPITDQHVAVAAAGSGRYIVAVVARAAVAGWMEVLGQHGIDPEAIVPAPLLLPVADELPTSLRTTDAMLVRGTEEAFEVEAGLAAMLYPAGTTKPVFGDQLELASRSYGADSGVNLRQGEFEKRRRFVVDRPRARRLAIIAAALAFVLLAIPLVELVRLNMATSALAARTAATARAVLPQGTPVTDPEAAMSRELAAATGSGVSGAVAALYAGLASGGIQIESLGYQSESGLRATLVTGIDTPLDGLRTRLADAGFQLVEGASRTNESGRHVDIEITPA